MARKPKKEEHVNHERWLVSYADFMTLLFAFFTSLYAISTVDARKAGKMVFSTRAAFNLDFFPSDKPVLGLQNANDPLGMNISDLPRQGSGIGSGGVGGGKGGGSGARSGGLNPRTARQLLQDLQRLVEGGKLAGISVRAARDGMVVSLKDTVFFAPGSATIAAKALKVLDPVLAKIIETRLDIRIEGHTDDAPIAGVRYRSNWELSTARAVSVLRHLTLEFAYPPERLSVAGYAAAKAQLGQDGAEGRASNRRVDLVLLAPTPTPTPSAAPPTAPSGAVPGLSPPQQREPNQSFARPPP